MRGMRSEQIPYGVKDFKRIRLEDFYYVDKTAFIRRMEERANFLFFVPLALENPTVSRCKRETRPRGTFVDALLSCPRFEDGDELDIRRFD